MNKQSQGRPQASADRPAGEHDPWSAALRTSAEIANLYVTSANALANLALSPGLPPKGQTEAAAPAPVAQIAKSRSTLIAIVAVFAACGFALARAGRWRRG